jgi:hypothetical protein
MAMPSIMGLFEMLPQLLLVVQSVLYIVLAWIFGSLAVRGLKKDIPFAIKILVVFGSGFICVMAGAALRGILFFLKGTVFEIMQMDSFIMGILAAVIFAISFYLITRDDEKASRDKTIKTLQQRVALLEGMLIKSRAPVLREDEVKKTAETLMKGFDAKEATLRKNDWVVTLAKEDRKALVVIGAFTGEVKHMEKQGSALARDPLKIVGAAVIVVLIALILMNFKGFPSMLDSIGSLLGMDPEDMQTLFGGSGDLPEGCVPTVRILMSQGVNIFGGEGSFEDESVRQMIEQETGRQVIMMYEVEYIGSNYVLSITLPFGSGVTQEELMKNSQICSSLGNTFCECINLPDINLPTGFIVGK